MNQTKSVFTSKINRLSLANVLSSAIILFGVDVSPEDQAKLLVGVNSLISVATFIARTWFTKKRIKTQS